MTMQFTLRVFNIPSRIFAYTELNRKGIRFCGFCCFFPFDSFISQEWEKSEFPKQLSRNKIVYFFDPYEVNGTYSFVSGLYNSATRPQSKGMHLLLTRNDEFAKKKSCPSVRPAFCYNDNSRYRSQSFLN